jgi:heme exporter protein CcmD
MPEFDRYAPFVLAAYAVAIGVLVGLVAWSVIRFELARRRLRDAEREGPP